jgi:hypothetical protein
MSVPYLGFGMGLRTCYFEQILTEQPAVFASARLLRKANDI